MRHAAFLLVVPALALAAPVPKELRTPPAEVTLASTSPRVLDVTIRNTGDKPLELTYHASPDELLVIDMRGENGTRFKIEYIPDDDDRKERGALVIPPGGAKTLSEHTCHHLHEVGKPGESYTFTVTLKLGDTTVTSKPLTVK